LPIWDAVQAAVVQQQRGARGESAVWIYLLRIGDVGESPVDSALGPAVAVSGCGWGCDFAGAGAG
jgi:hypothetical protein